MSQNTGTSQNHTHTINAFTHADQMMSTMGFKSIYKQEVKPHPEVLTYATKGLKLPKQEIKGAK